MYRNTAEGRKWSASQIEELIEIITRFLRSNHEDVKFQYEEYLHSHKLEI